MTVMVNQNGYPITLKDKEEKKFVYVNEQDCIGCYQCHNAAPATFFMEPDFGRARVYRQEADSEEVLDTAIDTCPVDCISKNSWFDLVQLELKRTE